MLPGLEIPDGGKKREREREGDGGWGGVPASLLKSSGWGRTATHGREGVADSSFRSRLGDWAWGAAPAAVGVACLSLPLFKKQRKSRRRWRRFLESPRPPGRPDPSRPVAIPGGPAISARSARARPPAGPGLPAGLPLPGSPRPPGRGAPADSPAWVPRAPDPRPRPRGAFPGWGRGPSRSKAQARGQGGGVKRAGWGGWGGRKG